MADFTKLSNFDPNANFNLVRWSASSPILEVELNEMQQILDKARADIIRQAIPSGVDFVAPSVFVGTNYTRTVLGEIQLSMTQPLIRLNQQKVNVNGYMFPITSWNNGVYTDVTLDPAPTFGTRDDLVFLEVWFQEVGGTGNSTGADTNVYYGGATVGNTVNTNNILDGRLNVETTHRVQLRWRIRVADGVDFTAYPDNGFSTTNWQGWVNSFNPKVTAQGGTSSPIVGNYSFMNNAGRIANSTSPNDSGLYIAGGGTSTDKSALNTVDGYVYAIPLFRVKRRNNGGYRVDNPNGARDYVSTATGTMTTTLNNVGSSYTITVNSTTGFNVGDTIYFAGYQPFQGVITAISSSTSLTYTCIANTGSYSLQSGQSVTKLSDRPDGLYSNIIDAEDIIDLRHQVSLTGFDRQMLLKSSFDKLMRAELRTNVKYTLQKEKYNLKRAPFGIAQQLQPVNVVGNDGVSRSLVNLLGTIGNFENGYTGFNANNVSLALDTSTFKYGKQSLKIYNGVGNASYNTSLDTTKYYLIAVDTNSGSTTSEMRFWNGTTNSKQTSPVVTNQFTTMFFALQPSDFGSGSGQTLYFDEGTSGNTVYLDGLRVYQIDQTTYNNINTGATGFATASDINSKFPYVDSYPNFAENLVPDFTNSGWSLHSNASVTSIYTLTLNATAGSQISTIDIPALPNTTYSLGFSSTGGYIDYHVVNANNIDTYISTAPSGYRTFTTNSDTTKIRLNLYSSSSGTFTFSNLQLEKVNTGISYPNPFVPFGRWFLQQDQFNPQLGGQNTILHNQNTLGGSFNGLRSNFSDAQISQTVVDVVESNGYTAQKHIIATQATKGQWTANDTVKINNYFGIVDGVVSGGEASRTIITSSLSGSTLTVPLDDVSKFAVNDSVYFTNQDMTPLNSAGQTVTITAIDTTNKTITFNNTYSWTLWQGSQYYVFEITASKSAPTVVDSSGNTIAGTWSGLGTKTATFTITTPPATNTSNLTITYSVSYPTGQGFSYLPLQSSDVLQASVNGDMLHSANTISAKANCKGKVSGNTDAIAHIIKVASANTLIAPSSFTGENSTSEYATMSSLDGSSYTYAPATSGNQAQQLFQFNLIRAIEDKFGEIPADGTANKITWIKNNVSNIEFDWYGYGSSVNGNKATMSIWSKSGSAWTASVNHTNAIVTKLSISQTIAGSNPSSFDTDGIINFLAYADPAGTVANPSTAPTLSASGSGSGLSAGTYYVTYQWANSNGSTMPSPEASITITAGQNIVVTVPASPLGVISTNIFISTTSGTETFQGYVNSPGTSYTQTNALSSGSAMASSNGCVISSTIYTDYVELQITLNTAETGFTVLQSDNPFPTLAQNLLNRNIAFPIDTGGFLLGGDGYMNVGASTSIDNTQTIQNFASSLKVTTTATNAYQGILVNNISANANTVYTVSMWFKGTSGKSYTLYLRDLTNTVISTVSIAATGSWQYITTTVKTGASAVSDLRFLVINTVSGVDTFWVTGIKLEQSPVATPWTPGRNKNFFLNYLGKVAGSTAENPNKFYYQGASSFPAPTTGYTEYPQGSQVEYNNIAQLDGTLKNYNVSTSGQYALQLFEFDLSHLGMSLTELKNALRSMTVNWTGYGSGDSAYVPTPTTAPTLGYTSTGGNLAPGTYYVMYTWKTSTGETMYSPQASYTIPSGTSTNALTVSIPGLPTNVTSANIYISTSSNGETLQGNTATTSYSQTVALVTGASLPASNTTGGTLTNGASLKFWQNDSSTWTSANTNTSSSPSTIACSNAYYAGDMTRFISPSQKMYVLVHSTYPASATNPSIIYTDYINLQVTLADYVDYVKSNIVKVRPSTMEIKTLFPAKSNRYTGFSGMAQESVIDLWYRHVPVYQPVQGNPFVTVLSESDGWLASDLGSNMGTVQGTHQYQNPLYRVGNDQQTTFGQLGFVRLDWSEDSRDVNTGAQVQLSNGGYQANFTNQNALAFVKKPIVAMARWLVLTQSGELQLLVHSVYTTNGVATVGTNSAKTMMLVPIQGRPLVRDPQGIQRNTIASPSQWDTPEGRIIGYMDANNNLIVTYN